MTTLKELNKLAIECEACAMNDHKSLNAHLKECTTCGEYFNRAETFNIYLEELKEISKKDDMDLHRTLHEKFSGIANMEDSERNEVLTGIYDAISVLPEKDRIRFVKTRTDVLTDFPKYERDPIMTSLSGIAKKWDKERISTERRYMQKATDDYPVLKKVMVRNMFDRMLE